jgi:prepilin signal peptidase PulO-like enzyme (type II secretory pathway)
MFINYLVYLFVFLFGLCIGSFLNCFVYRLEQDKTMSGRSFCPNCKHTLSFFDLFPVFSFLFLNAKCRYCHKKISWQYPLVEIATGLIFLLIFYAKGGQAFSWNFLNIIFLFYIFSVLIIIFIYDLKHYLIPDKVLFPAIIISLLYNLINWQNILNVLLAVVIASGFFLTIFLISRGKWMGFGDVKLAILMGLLLGFPSIIVALFLAFFLGAIIGLTLMILDKKGLKSEIPFGPFLITGTFLAFLWGSQIINWYLNLFLIV